MGGGSLEAHEYHDFCKGQNKITVEPHVYPKYGPSTIHNLDSSSHNVLCLQRPCRDSICTGSTVFGNVLKEPGISAGSTRTTITFAEL